MITAIDSSVLLAIINREPEGAKWEILLAQAVVEGRLTICPVVFAECSPRFSSVTILSQMLEQLHIRYDQITKEAAYTAGQIFKTYRRSGGPREHMIPDFLIGAHALHQADRLAALDRGYLRRYFPQLLLLQPS